MRLPIFYLLSLLSLLSCRKKYEIMNMEPQKIDVTKYIESGQFRPDSCKGRLDRLVKIKPSNLTSDYEKQLQSALEKWAQTNSGRLFKNDNDTINLGISDLVGKTTYRYSYFLTNEPLDVYLTDLSVQGQNNNKIKLFIRIDGNGTINSGYDEDGWIISSCDSLN